MLGCFRKNPHGKQGYTNADERDNQAEKQNFFVHNRCFYFCTTKTVPNRQKIVKFSNAKIRHVRIQLNFVSLQSV